MSFSAVSLHPLLALPPMKWRQSVNDRCSGSEQGACSVEHSLSHAICSYPGPWALVPEETRKQRDLSVVTELAPSAPVPLHRAIWCMALLTFRSATVQCIGRKARSASQGAQHTTSAFVFSMQQVSLCCRGRRGERDQHQSAESISCRVILIHSPQNRSKDLLFDLRIFIISSVSSVGVCGSSFYPSLLPRHCLGQ